MEAETPKQLKHTKKIRKIVLNKLTTSRKMIICIEHKKKTDANVQEQ